MNNGRIVNVFNGEHRKLTGIVLLDFTAALDVIEHSILIAKLKFDFIIFYFLTLNSCLGEELPLWLVFFKGSFYDRKIKYKISCRVPQGSCFGPSLFSVFINYLPYVILMLV